MATRDVPEELKMVPVSADSPDNRMPPIPDGDLTDEQRDAIAAFEAKRGRSPGGPFIPLLRSPVVMQAANKLGAYLRFESELPMELSEFAIIITARKWTQNYEWLAHRKIAESAGLPAAIADAVAEGRRPQDMTDAQDTVYDFCTELHGNGQVSDYTYARAKAAFGERGIIDLATICGYYSMLAMVMNVARTPLPQGAKGELVPFNR